MTMDGLLLFLFLAAFPAIGIAIMVHNWRAGRRIVQAVAESAERRGWRFQARPGRSVIYRIEGETGSGVGWSVAATYNQQRGSGVEIYTRWRAAGVSAPPGVGVLVGARGLIALKQQHWFSTPLAQSFLYPILGSEVNAVAGLEPVAAGSDLFRERYGVLATDERLAAELVTGGLQAAMLEWPAGQDPTQPLILFSDDGLQVRLGYTVRDGADIERLVALGEVALESALSL
jgi:hypothetical protein